MSRAPSSANGNGGIIGQYIGDAIDAVRTVATRLTEIVGLAAQIDDVVNARDDAVNAADAAQVSATASDTARAASITAKDDSVTARIASEAARDASVAAKVSAEAAAASVSSGTYNPNSFNIAAPPDNTTNTVITKARYMRMGNTVQVTAYGSTDIITADMFSLVGFGLPFNSEFDRTDDAIGVGYIQDQVGMVSANTTANGVVLGFVPPAGVTGTVQWRCSFQYEVK